MTQSTALSEWGNRYISLAKEISTWSKDPSKKIGAVAVGEKGQILAQGYNGFPRGIADTVERYNDRPTKYKLVVHAEMNVIYNATYNGVSLNNSRLFVYGLPVCSDCAKGIIQVGVQSVTVYTDGVVPDTWIESYELTNSMFKEAGVSCLWIQS